MNAASLPSSAYVPVAAAPATAFGGGAAAGGITPAAGQGFVAVSADQAKAAMNGAAAAPSGAGAAGQTATAPAQAQGGSAAADGIPVEQALQALQQVLGKEYGEPIYAADGSVYMEKKQPDVMSGRLTLSYVLVGKVDKKTGKMKVNAALLEQLKAKAAAADGSQPQKKLVKVDDQYVWQTFSKNEEGKVIAEVTPATEQELQAYQQKLQAQQTQQAAQQKLQNNADWQQKVGTVAQTLGLFGSTGQFITALGAGPNPHTGQPSATWISGWILAQRLNGKAEGKLLPKWIQSGPGAMIMDWGLQVYGMLDVGNDLRTVRDFLKKAPPLPDVNPNAVQQLIAQGQHPEMAKALAQLGKDLRTGGANGGPVLGLVQGTANAAVLNTQAGAVQLVSKDALSKAFAATDPLQDAGLKARDAFDRGVVKGLGVFKGLIGPAMMGATALNFVSSVIGVKNLAAKNGVKVLLDHQQGRASALGAASSAAFLGVQLLPMALQALGTANPAIAAARSAVNIASNVIGGVQLLNQYGLFGGDGFLDNDAVRSAFLIPPLTPIGAFAFYMRSRKKKAEAEAAKLESAQKLAVERIQQQREMVKLQLQSGQAVTGGSSGQDGSIRVATTVPNDLSQLTGGSPGGSSAGTGGSSGGEPAGTSSANASVERQQRLAMVARR